MAWCESMLQGTLIPWYSLTLTKADQSYSSCDFKGLILLLISKDTFLQRETL